MNSSAPAKRRPSFLVDVIIMPLGAILVAILCIAFMALIYVGPPVVLIVSIVVVLRWLGVIA